MADAAIEFYLSKDLTTDEDEAELQEWRARQDVIYWQLMDAALANVHEFEELRRMVGEWLLNGRPFRLDYGELLIELQRHAERLIQPKSGPTIVQIPR